VNAEAEDFNHTAVDRGVSTEVPLNACESMGAKSYAHVLHRSNIREPCQRRASDFGHNPVLICQTQRKQWAPGITSLVTAPSCKASGNAIKFYK
jgi:hypothetical protein